MARFELSQHAAEVARARSIQPDWIDRCLFQPAKTEPDPVDPTLTHALLPIAENDGRVLRVVYNPVANPLRVVTLFFDRRMRGKV